MFMVSFSIPGIPVYQCSSFRNRWGSTHPYCQRIVWRWSEWSVFSVRESGAMQIDPPKSSLFLFAAFYAFNMQYPKGLVSLYTFLEIFLFNKRPKKIPSIVSSILSCLNTTNWTVTIIMLSIMHIQIFFSHAAVILISINNSHTMYFINVIST